MATHSSTLAWEISWTEEPSRLQSMGSRRVGHGWVTSLSLFTFMHWRRKWQPTPAWRIPGTGAWWVAIYEVAQSRTGLTWLSSSRWINSRELQCNTMPIVNDTFYAVQNLREWNSCCVLTTKQKQRNTRKTRIGVRCAYCLDYNNGTQDICICPNSNSKCLVVQW